MTKRAKLDIQPTLFEIPGQWTHDYGDAAGDGEDFGHEFPFVRGNEVTFVETQEGVSVDLVERRMALKAVADMYGMRNRGKGMKEAVDAPIYRRELETRYFDVDYVAERAEANGEYTYEEERAALQPILKEQELVGAGFVEGDVDHVAISVISEVRKGFGVGVRSRERQKNLKKLK